MTTINVTAEHIANGKRSDCGSCPIALAIKEVVNSEVQVGVGAGSVTFNRAGVYRTLELPLDAKHFIFNFDGGFPVVPFAFELLICGRDLKCVTPNPA